MYQSGGFRLALKALVLACLGFASTAHAALTFNFTFIAGTSTTVQAGFNAAASRWSSLLTDNVTLNMTVGSGALGNGILAQAGSAELLYSFSAFRTALSNDRTSANDFTAVANLPTSTAFGMLINHTSDNPNGANSATPYLDTAGANNQTVALTSANAKALGLTVSPAATVSGCIGSCDAFIQFSNSFNFDYDPNDGITAGAYDFVGIATHELGHALGFISGVDSVDFNPGFTANSYRDVTSLDLFRYSSQSAALGVIDFTADTRSKYFSIDRGASILAAFSTGVNLGDGNQASHWKDSLSIGILDPTAAPGEKLSISTNDTKALDVIGWNLGVTQAPVPEPSTWMSMLFGLAAMGYALRRKPALRKSPAS
jgi:hypothetical protein